MMTRELANEIRKAIEESVAAVLKQRNIRDAGNDLARELARNSAQNVVFLLEEHDDSPIVTPAMIEREIGERP